VAESIVALPPANRESLGAQRPLLSRRGDRLGEQADSAPPRFRMIQVCPKDLRAALWQAIV
jgi:hypothetical protein